MAIGLAMNLLSREDRELIRLVYFEEKDIAAAAAALGLTRDVANTRLVRARRLLATKPLGVGRDHRLTAGRLASPRESRSQRSQSRATRSVGLGHRIRARRSERRVRRPRLQGRGRSRRRSLRARRFAAASTSSADRAPAVARLGRVAGASRPLPAPPIA